MQRVTALQRGISWIVKWTNKHRTIERLRAPTSQILVQRCFSVSPSNMAYKMVERGRLNTMDYRVYISE